GCNRAADTGKPCLSAPHCFRTPEKRDAPMPHFNEMTPREKAALLVVAEDLGCPYAGDVFVQNNDPPAASGDRIGKRTIVGMIGYEDDAVARHLAHPPQVFPLSLLRVEGGAKRKPVTSTRRLALHCCRKARKVWVGDIGNHETERIGFPAAQTAGVR